MKLSAASAWRRAIAILFIALGCGSQAGMAWAQDAAPAIRELHVVGVYEGARGAGDKNDVRPIVPVTIDRPGASVVLVLLTYEPVRWRVRASPQTRIESITLGGHKTERSEVRVGDAVYGDAVRRPDLDNVHEPRGSEFRALVETLPGNFGLKRMSSFSGRYAAPAGGFSISKTLPSDPRLDPDYLTTLLAKPADLPSLAFAAAIDGKPGIYSLTGEKVGDAEFVNDRTTIYVPERKIFYSFTYDGFTSRAAIGGKQGAVSPPVTLPEISWPTSLAWDSKRQRLVGLSLGGEGYAYAYDPDRDVWSPAMDLKGVDTDAIEYDSQRDRFIIAVTQLSGSFRLLSMSPQLQVSDIDSIAFSRLAGYEDIGQPPIDILHVDRRYVVLAASSPDGGRRSVGAPTRIWLYDLEKRTVALTWRKR